MHKRYGRLLIPGEEPVLFSIGRIIDFLISGGTVIVNDLTEYKIIITRKDGEDVFQLCDRDLGNIKYFRNPKFDELIKIFANQEIKIKEIE